MTRIHKGGMQKAFLPQARDKAQQEEEEEHANFNWRRVTF
jgi:hypothetical protein